MLLRNESIALPKCLVFSLNLIGLGPYDGLSKYSYLQFLSSIVATLNILCFVSSSVLYGALLITFGNLEAIVKFHRFLSAFLLFVCFVVTVWKKWNNLTKKWNYCKPSRLMTSRKRIYEVFGIFGINIVEHCLVMKAVVDEVINVEGSFSIEGLFKVENLNLHAWLPHSLTLDVVLHLFSIIIVLEYSLVNAFLVLLLVEFNSKLAYFSFTIDKRLSTSRAIGADCNKFIKANAETYWSFARKDYNKLCDLFEALNDFCSHTIFLYILPSITNAFIMIMLIISDFEESPQLGRNAIFGLICEVLRTRTMLITASDIFENHKRIARVMYSKITSSDYNNQSLYLLRQITLRKMCVKVFGTFKLTREFIFVVFATMVSYSAILLQLIPYLLSLIAFKDEEELKRARSSQGF